METKGETNESQEKKNFFSSFDLQSMMTIFYISIVVIGMMFNYFKYGIFKINIFEHSDIFDFLIAPLGDLGILVFTLATLFFTFLIYVFDKTVKARYPKAYSKMYLGTVDKPWFQTAYNVQWIAFIALYLTLSAIYYSMFEKKKILKRQDKIEVAFVDGTKMTGIKIGANTSFHFMLDDSTNVRIIPTSSIKNIKTFKMKDKE